MKRIASSILVLVMLLSFSALFAVAENGVTVIDGGAYVSISVGKKYTSTGTRYANSAYSDTDAAGNMLGKLTDENRARLDASYHRIQLLQHIYQLKHTVNQ